MENKVTSLRFLIDGELVAGHRTCSEIAEEYGFDNVTNELPEMDCLREVIGGGQDPMALRAPPARVATRASPATVSVRHVPASVASPARMPRKKASVQFSVADFDFEFDADEPILPRKIYKIKPDAIIGKIFADVAIKLQRKGICVDTDYLHFFIRSRTQEMWRRLRYNFTYNQLVEREDVASGQDMVEIYFLSGTRNEVKEYLDSIVENGEDYDFDSALSHAEDGDNNEANRATSSA